MSSIHGSTPKKPLFQERFRFIRPTLPPLDSFFDDYSRGYAEGMITNSTLVARLEASVAERLQVAHCVAVSSCTSGLMIVLRALDLRGEVIMPSFTFFATGHAALWNGLKPVFADCTSDTWTLDPDEVERRITDRTCAILAVHMYGNPCHIERLSAIAGKYNLKLVFDAAHAFGSRHGERPIGQFGDAEVFSLSPTKLLIAGEGGLVATNDATLAHRLRAARNYGDLGAYDPELLGLNARMSEFNAALALAGLPLVDEKVKRHNAIAATYTRLLNAIPGVRFQKILPEDTSAYKDYSIHLQNDASKLTRDDLASVLLAENIETRKYFFPPLHRQQIYKNYRPAVEQYLKRTDSISEGVLSLPIYESLPEDTVEKVALAIRNALL
jgi:dTDP-4-amino-4,6-dideoxygalactose transaminase